MWRYLTRRRYLDTALAYSDWLLGRQQSSGFWPTGYGAIYLADTGSALGLFIALYHHASPERQKRFLDATLRYADSIAKNGMIHPNGAFGTGWGHVEGDTMSKPIPDQYTLSSALTGGEIYTWLVARLATRSTVKPPTSALKWVLSTMRGDGNIPYILAEEGADWDKHGDAKNDYELWEDMTYGTAGYVGEQRMAKSECPLAIAPPRPDTTSVNAIAIIPARIASTRLPRKILRHIRRPMLAHVYDAARACATAGCHRGHRF